MAQPQPDIFSQIVSRFFDLLILVIGGLLGFVSSWAVSKRERKEARADQRRERIYGPLHDELDTIQVALLKTEDIFTPSGSVGSTYERVKAEHILYMIPRELRNKIIEVYEESLPNYDSKIVILRNKYRLMMYTSLCTALGLSSTSSNYVANLASLSYWLLQETFPENKVKEIDTALFVMSEDSHEFPYAKGQDYFRYWKNQMREDPEFKQFEQMRKQIMNKVQEINEAIRTDLESEN
jgi:hypothetical protein